MKREGIIKESTSPWSSPILVVPKKDQGYRLCVDYRQLNKVTEYDPFPLPHIQDLIENVPNPKFITKLDLKSGYWQVGLDPDSQAKTAFCVRNQKYEFTRMPFGLASAPSTFQRLMNHVLKDGAEYGVYVYLDDILILSENWQTHLIALKYVFGQLRKYNLTLRLHKCNIAENETKVLGYILSERGLEIDPDKITAIQQCPPPKNLKELQRFLGMAGWHQKFIPQFAHISQPLHHLRRNDTPWIWGPAQQLAFTKVKQAIADAALLHNVRQNEPVMITTDASDLAIGAMLSQLQDGIEKPIAYASRLLQPAETRYSAMEKECLAVIWAIKKFHHYLDGNQFSIFTDHHSLCWLLNVKDPTSRVGRWALKLQGLTFTIHHRQGKTNVVADWLSRAPINLQAMPVTPTPNPIDVVTPDDIKREQQQDPRTQALIMAVTQNEAPQHIIINDILYRKAWRDFPQVIEIPQALIQPLLTTYHDHPGVGHRGRDITINRLREKFYWPSLYKDTMLYVKNCQLCQRYAYKNKAPAGLMASNPLEGPWQFVGLEKF